MNDTFEIRSSAFEHDMAPWCAEKSERVVEGLVRFIEWSHQQHDWPDDFAEAKTFFLQPALDDALKLLAFSCGARWSAEDVELVLRDGEAGFKTVLKIYGLLSEQQ